MRIIASVISPAQAPGKARRSLFAVLLLAATHQVLGATDCASMLQPYFDWAAKSDTSYIYPVYATMVGEAPTSLTYATRDPAWYANGLVTRQTNWGPTLGGDLQLQFNSSNFGVNTANTMALSVASNGFVSVQQKINGTPVGLLPPMTFLGTCTNGLISGTAGSTAYIISFTKGSPMRVIDVPK